MLLVEVGGGGRTRLIGVDRNGSANEGPVCDVPWRRINVCVWL